MPAGAVGFLGAVMVFVIIAELAGSFWSAFWEYIT